MFNALDVRIERKHLAAFAQQMHQVPSISAARIQNPHSRRNVPPQNLIENVNVDLPELLPQVHSRRHCVFAFSRSTTSGGTNWLTSAPNRNTPLISRELTYVYFSAGIMNSVSSSGSSLRFIIAIWNSYS